MRQAARSRPCSQEPERLPPRLQLPFRPPASPSAISPLGPALPLRRLQFQIPAVRLSRLPGFPSWARTLATSLNPTIAVARLLQVRAAPSPLPLLPQPAAAAQLQSVSRTASALSRSAFQERARPLPFPFRLQT